MEKFKTPSDLADKINKEDIEWDLPTDAERKMLLDAGFQVDDTYSGGDTYFYDDFDGPWSRSTINLRRPKGSNRFTATIRGNSFAYPDLAMAIDRAKYISGKSPYDGSLKWNGRDWE